MIFISVEEGDAALRIAWIFAWPGMISLCVSKIFFTTRITIALSNHDPKALEAYEKTIETHLIGLVEKTRKPMSRRNRLIVTATIVADLHAKDILILLIDKGVKEETNFDWQAQLRYYIEDYENSGKILAVRMMDSRMNYGCEYLGNQMTCPLAITPLTDRCYRTLVEARNYCLYGALEGPVATGKTETVRSLARAVGTQCVVVGCSEHLDYVCTGNILKGVASCGAWVCLDDFHRIEAEVLSVVGQQIQAITRAVQAEAKKFEIEGASLRLNPAFNICVTLTPRLAGRSTVPDNTRTLFRTVAMVIPDFLRICEIELFAGGLASGKILAKKILTAHELCADLFATEVNYDFGLRAIKTVLRTAVHLKLRFPDQDDTLILFRSIIDAHLGKFLERDVLVFQGVLSDLFPGLVLPPPNYKPILEALRNVCELWKLRCHETFELKAIQIFETIWANRGSVIIGETLGGKTSVLRCLAAALTLLADKGDSVFGRVTEIRTINPKAVTISDLFGRLDRKTRTWRDGIVSSMLRQFAEEEPAGPRSSWLVFDGPVESGWAESLNTVLDDNGMLCLISGEKIRLSKDSISLVFETLDLVQASPGTISRCGIIHIEPRSSGWKPIVNSWLETWHCAQRTYAGTFSKTLLEWLIDPCLNYVQGKL